MGSVYGSEQAGVPETTMIRKSNPVKEEYRSTEGDDSRGLETNLQLGHREGEVGRRRRMGQKNKKCSGGLYSTKDPK